MDASPDLATIVAAHPTELALPGVLSVRSGYQVSNGWLTGRRAIVVTVAHKTASPPGGTLLPTSLDGVPVDVRQASPRKRQELTQPQAEPVALDPADGALPAFDDERTPAGTPIVAPARIAGGGAAAAAKPTLPYTAPPGVALREVSGHAVVHACASPDAGWPALKEFLAAVTESLTIGLYDFTSAHILDWISTQLPGKKVRLVLDHPARNPTADQTDEQTVTALKSALGLDLAQAWALDGMDPLAAARIFPTAYHIKVAVRDHTSIWLSSGNWNNSNQPDIDPVTTAGDADAARNGDRDWHVIIDQPQLAALFEAYLTNDFSQASAHNQAAGNAIRVQSEMLTTAAKTPPFAQFYPPLTVTGSMRIIPLLTPDRGSYAPHVKTLITNAKSSLYMQFQYIELPKTPGPTSAGFSDLVAAVAARQNAGVDVKIIMSEYEKAGYLEQLQAAGIDVVNNVKIQNNVHNKGIVVDNATVLVSSQNWSTDGTLYNRDAGVIIHNAKIASYFQTIFMHDWANLAHQKAASD